MGAHAWSFWVMVVMLGLGVENCHRYQRISLSHATQQLWNTPCCAAQPHSGHGAPKAATDVVDADMSVSVLILARSKMHQNSGTLDEDPSFKVPH
jgi:hypothetical protein